MHTEQLLEEIEAGQGETLTRIARRFPRTRQDKPVTLSCLVRWVLTGVRGPIAFKCIIAAFDLGETDCPGVYTYIQEIRL